jgi:hypothetical protein
MIERDVGETPAPLQSPGLRLVEPQAPPRWEQTERLALKLFAGAGIGLVLTFVAALLAALLHQVLPIDDRLATLIGRWSFAVPLGLASISCGLGVLTAVAALAQMLWTRDRPSAISAVAIIFFEIGAASVATLIGAFFSVWAASGFRRGRQLRRFGKILLPPVTPGDAWASLPLQVNSDPDLRSALAAQWRQNGRTEHASIAAFAKLTLDLVALGAPPKLIADSQRDALDELRHTELCFSLARALDSKAESPGPFPAARSASGASGFLQLAVDSLIDGALHEGVSARVIAQLVKRCDEPAIREVLRELAADEGRHAAHGWDVVEWCVEQGGEAVREALLGAVQGLPTTIALHLPEAARGGAWERFGIHGEALERAENAAMVENLKRRVRALSPRARAA